MANRLGMMVNWLHFREQISDNGKPFIVNGKPIPESNHLANGKPFMSNG